MRQFLLQSSREVPILNARLDQYLEPELNVRHVHLATDQQELAFLVAFPTVPQLSDGRAHILEHLALCGSERFPVADPFFAMLRRSTATFMNAMTYPDRTVYPFATTDKADFFNLLDVYLDATFFPKLDYLSFRQEGWRYALEGGKLVYQGVVLNEMKGAFGNPMRALSHGIKKVLLEGTTYANESGGDPLAIPSLTHEALTAFHAAHYHPSQAIFMTAGCIAAQDVQERLLLNVIARTGARVARTLPELAADWVEPRRVEILVPSQAARDDEFGVQIAWRLGEASDPMGTARLHLLSAGLLAGPSAPLQKAMQTAGFGRPSRMNGSDSGARQLVFHLGMEGLLESQVEPALALIQDSLKRVAEEGVPATVLKAALRDMRFQMQEVRGGSMPDMLGRLLGAVPVVMYGGDAADALDKTRILNQLEEEIDNPSFFGSMVQRLLDQANCVVSTIRPDAQYHSTRERTEQERLSALEHDLSESSRQLIQEENEAISARRKQGSNTQLLPRIAPTDVSREPRSVPEIQVPEDGVVSITVPSNGISYASLNFDASGFSKEEMPWLILLSDLLPQLGVSTMGYDEASAWCRRLVPEFGVFVESYAKDLGGAVGIRMGFYADGLVHEQDFLAEVIQLWSSQARFDELDRIAFLVRSRTERFLTNLPEAGNQFASLAAGAPLSEKRRFEHQVRGAGSLPFILKLKARMNEPDGVRYVAANLESVYRKLGQQRAEVVWATSADDSATAASRFRQKTVSAKQSIFGSTSANLGSTVAPVNTGFILSGQVNHCIISWKTPLMDHADAAPLAVAAELLSHRVLHRRIREQGGAYGGSASYSEEDGVFSMSSFRDPRLTETFRDFQEALEEVSLEQYTRQQLDEAIIGVVKRLDKPLSPYEQAMEAVHLRLRGVHAALRREYRRKVLDCSLDDVRAAVDTWLRKGVPSRAAAVSRQDQVNAGLDLVSLM